MSETINLERIRALSPERLMLAQKLLKQHQKKPAHHNGFGAPIPRRLDQSSFPMSYAQQRMWFIDQLQPANHLYNEHGQLHLRGRVDLALLESTVNEIVQRHQSLRTNFELVEGQPAQVIKPELRLTLPLIDLQHLPEAEKLERVRCLASLECREPFDLAHEPLLRFKILRLSETEHYIFVTMHQIISDGWSVWLFTNEVAKVYEAFALNQPSPLPAPQLQYPDYAEWHKELMHGEMLQSQLRYWKECLNGCAPYLDLPTDYPHTAVRNFDGGTGIRFFSPELSNAIEDLGKSQGVTSFVPMTAALMLLWQRFNGQPDISITVPVAGRNHLDVEQMIGFFVNVLILRASFAGEPDFYELMRRVNEAAVGAYAHQDLPFDKLIEEIHPERSLRRAPFFDILLNFNNLPQTPLVLPGLTITRVDLHRPVSKFPITVYISKEQEQFCIRFLYQAELFTPERIEEFLDQFELLLQQAVTAPHRAVKSYSLVTPRAAANLPDPTTPLEAPTYLPLTENILAHAGRSPDSPAIRQAEQFVTYRELVERAETLARLLVAKGVKRGDTVALVGSRSCGMVISMLATLLGGGVILSLDRRLPSYRRQLMLQEAETKIILLLRDEGDNEELELEAALEKIVVEAATGLPAGPIAAERLRQVSLPTVSSQDRAYIFFTSGTAAQPKAVLGWHNALSHFLNWQRTTFEIKPEERCGHLTGLSFDVVLRDIFLPLTSGATLCLPDDPEDLAPDRILPWLQRENISLIHLTPTIAQSWLAHEAEAVPLPRLKYLFFAGEPLLDSLIYQWRKSFPSSTRMINLYGPTETTLAKFAKEIPAAAVGLPQTQPVGRPLPHTQALVMRDGGHLCGANELGEIVIRTPFRSLGYLHAETAERPTFRPNPFTDDPQDLLYWTGDLGRFRADGELEIVGRVDEQVKIRGVRIQPEEIASTLLEHPHVDACAVIVQKDEQAGSLLAAYVVPQRQAALQASDLRAYLFARLPGAFVPEAFVFLDKLPMTANNKIDKKALPQAAPSTSKAGQGRNISPPRTPFEEQLVKIWANVLKLDEVSIHDNFFEIGGHSLLAIKMMHEVRKQLRLNVPLRLLFESPTIAELAEAAERSKVIDEERGEMTSLPPITLRPEERYEPFPLTDVQQAYWIGRDNNFDLGQVATHNYSEYEFLDLDVERLRHAFNRLIKRHDALRLIVCTDGQQRILKTVEPYRIEVCDLRQHQPEEKKAAIQAIRHKLSHQVLPLDRWPLFEVLVSQLDERKFILHISVDALTCDAWSRRLLGRELLQLYQADVELPPLELSFRDYILAEREWRSTEEYQEAKTYWLKRLDTLPPAPQLPLTRNAASIERPHFVRTRRRLEKETWTQLKARAAKNGLTPSGLMCAVYAEILGLWSRSQRFTINLTLFNRRPVHPQVNDIVGDFTSLVLLAVEEQPGDTFLIRARRIQEQLWTDLDHSAFSGVEVLRELHRRNGGGTNALMPVVLTSTLFESNQGSDEMLTAWQEDMVYGISQTPQVYLDHGVSEQGGELIYGWDAIVDMFPAGVIEEMMEAYSRLLKALASDETAWQRTLRDWLLPSAQALRRQQFNDTSSRLPTDLLHQPFQAQALARPHAPAILSERRCLTYAQLQGEVSHLARRLRSLGTGAGQVVAVVMEKGWEQVVAVLSILEAGAAYLPVDASLPAARRNYLMQSTEVSLALTQPWLCDRLSEWPAEVAQQPVRELTDDEWQAAYEEGLLSAVQEMDDLAYIIFTSGSTGQPKGVMMSHLGAQNTLNAINERFAISERDRVLALSALNFDLSVYDIFGVLGAGGSIVLPSAESLRDPQQWTRQIKEHAVTVWNSVPALMEMLVESVSAEATTETGQSAELGESLRLVLLSGDWINVSLPRRIRQLVPQAQVVSLGGATECAVWSVLHEIEEVKEEWRSIPYGRPLPNQRLYVLNEKGESSPECVTGEIYIGGAGLALGYKGDEQKTKQRFISRQSTEKGEGTERLYRTGDLGRYQREGWIEFLGREDTQVKVQGHRIELGEIEASLVAHEGVKEAVVTAVGEAGGSRRLVAYLVAQSGVEVDRLSLQTFLRGQLPEYMIPQAWVMLDQLPLSSNGKVNRAALPDPELGADSRQAEGGEADTLVEEVIAGVWSQLLGHERVGRQENFFVLGGDSITGVQMLSRLSKIFKVELPLRRLFESSTVEQLGSLVSDAMRAGQQSVRANAIKPVSRDGELPLSFAQERIWFLSQMEPQNSFYNIPVAIRINGALNQEALRQAVNELAQRHENLRAYFENVRGQAVQKIAPTLSVSVPLIDLSQQPRSEAERIASEEGWQPFDLTQAPLWRIKLLRWGAQEFWLLLTIHHIISDARSIEVLVSELARLHTAYAGGTEAGLPPLTLQYVDFAAWQRELMESGLFAEQMNYWNKQFSVLPPALRLRLAPPSTTRDVSIKGGRQTFALSEELTEALRKLTREEGSTLFITLLSAFYILLFHHSKQEDLVVSSSISNRQGNETEQVVGCFLNTVLLRARVEPKLTFRDLLAQVREVAFGAYANQDFPFERLIQNLLPGRELSYAPLANVVFGLRTATYEVDEHAPLTFQTIELERRTAKFDLELQMLNRRNGITGFLEYDAAKFDARAIAKLVESFEQTLLSITRRPESTVAEVVESLKRKAATRRALKHEEQGQNTGRRRIRNVELKPVVVQAGPEVRMRELRPHEKLPLLVEPQGPVVLKEWLRANSDAVKDKLRQHGGILFRGFDIGSTRAFEEVAVSFTPQLLDYKERSTPRQVVEGKIYTSTNYPMDQKIFIHNENSYSHTWPMKIWFCCLQPAAVSGETPIADSRKVYQLINPAVREKFIQRKLMYTRTYRETLGLSWEEGFQTSDPAQVENYCRQHHIQFKWLSQDGDSHHGLQTSQVREAAIKHPLTGEWVWFNQAHLFHVSSLNPEVRSALINLIPEEQFPRNVYFGDGQPIEEESLAHIREVYEDESVVFRWQRNDILLLDNILVAHGRMPYQGVRKVVVALAEQHKADL